MAGGHATTSGRTGARATPRKAVFTAAPAKVVAGEAGPASAIEIKRVVASVVVAYTIGTAPLQSTARPRAPVELPVPKV